MAKSKSSRILFSFFFVLTAVISYVAYRTRRVPTPRRKWKRFDSPDATALDVNTCQQLQGIYRIKNGNTFFGETAVLKYSYTIEKEGTFYHLSFFCEKNGTYFICEGKKQDTAILLYGHWRKAAANGTGLVQLVLKAADVDKENRFSSLVFEGMFGDDDKKPDQPLSLHYLQPLPGKPGLEIIAHRGGARNVDFLHVSENSLEMMKMAARLGATGVEIDVRMTKDGVPVIFHDSFLSIHTIRGKIYGGLIHNHKLEDLKKIELRKGGRIPTLEECLDTILYQTPLELVWLDIKKECDLEMLHQMQHHYMHKAAAIGRRLIIYLGIPDNYLLRCFTKLKNHKEIPSLTELNVDVAIGIKANVWAPQYTNGFQRKKVAKAHAAGSKAFVWSLDNRTMVDMYIKEGGFDGLVTNTPSVVAHWYYTAVAKAPEAH